MRNYVVVVIAMALVTFIPRMLPMVLLKDVKLPSFATRFLKLIPFAALGALIFPGILTSTGDTNSAIAGGLVALVLAGLRMNLILVVFGSIGGVFIWQTLFG